MKSLTLSALLTIGAFAHANPPCDVYLDASSDEGTLRGLIARTNLHAKLTKRLTDANLVALNAPAEEDIQRNEKQWRADAAAESVSLRMAYTAMVTHPVGRGLLLQETFRTSEIQPTRAQLIEETIFHEFGIENPSYTHLIEYRDRLSHAQGRLQKHMRTLGRVIGYLDRARWWAGGVHVPDASWYNVNPVSLGYRHRARQLAARMNRTLQPDMIEIDLLLEPGHPVINEITADEGTARLKTFLHRLENTKDQLSVSRALVEARVNEIITRVTGLLPPHE